MLRGPPLTLFPKNGIFHRQGPKPKNFEREKWIWDSDFIRHPPDAPRKVEQTRGIRKLIFLSWEPENVCFVLVIFYRENITCQKVPDRMKPGRSKKKIRNGLGQFGQEGGEKSESERERELRQMEMEMLEDFRPGIFPCGIPVCPFPSITFLLSK